MAREACIVLETVSRDRAKEIAALLSTNELDVEREEDVVHCFVTAVGRKQQRRRVRAVRRIVSTALAEAGLRDALVRPPHVRLWNEARHRYVEVHHSDLADEDWVLSDLAPLEITYVVEVVPANAFELRPTRRALRRLRRPILRGGLRHLDVAARDEADALRIVAAASALPVVRSATPRPLGRWRQWLLRQRVAGNYASESGDYFFVQGVDGGGGNGGGGNGGG